MKAVGGLAVNAVGGKRRSEDTVHRQPENIGTVVGGIKFVKKELCLDLEYGKYAINATGLIILQ